MTNERSEWMRRGIGAEAHEALARGLPGSELWSLLLDVFDQRASGRTPASLLSQWERDTFTRPSYLDQRTALEIDVELLRAASQFEAVELSPLTPLGTCSAVAVASQNKIVSALRGTEVVSDPTNVFALESARRLRKDAKAIVRLATSQRVVRAQAIPDKPGFAQHFRIFCLGTAGLEQKDHAFTASAIVEHVTTMLRALDRLEAIGYAFGERSVRVLSTPARAALGARIAASVTHARVAEASLDHPYYDGIRYQIDARTAAGDVVPLIDGGAFDWLEKLTSNRRLVFVASGMGSQLVSQLFQPARGDAEARSESAVIR